MTISFQSILDAETRIGPYKIITPLLTSDRLNQKLPFDLFVKADCLQRTGSFKFRGACNAVFSLGVSNKPILAYSSGNHAQAVAAASKITGRQATIVMPEDSTKAKLDGTAFWGATIIKYNRNKENREEIGKRIAKELNATIIPPFDDEKVIIGQGTAGIECIEQLNKINVIPDIVLCCCGGGGLIAGIGTALKAKFKNAKIFSVEPENFDDTKKSLAVNSIMSNDMNHTSICDALLADKPGKITFEINRLNLTTGVAVSDKEALIAMNTAFRHLKIVLEPGGAVALAAAIFKKINIKNKNVLVIASGGNVDKDVFENCLNEQQI